MLILLPPSETKRDGGTTGSALDLNLLGFPKLTRSRRTVLAALRKLARNQTKMSAALHLGSTQQAEVLRNRSLGVSPTLHALHRYTGVLFDALDAHSLPEDAHTFALDHVVIHSALFGLVRGGDPIPAYRLSHNTRLADTTLKKVWRNVIASELAERPELVLDLRSEGYVELGPSSGAAQAYFVRVVAEGVDGVRRALNHFNKKGKGEFARAIVRAGIDHPDVESLIHWAASAGIRLNRSGEHELELVVAEVSIGHA
ncbi:MAG: peroxide stress protein YaaA [Lacisediminihabitans sp.]